MKKWHYAIVIKIRDSLGLGLIYIIALISLMIDISPKLI